MKKIYYILKEYNTLFFKFFFVLLIIIFSCYRLKEHNAPIILMDEFGYWSNGAFLVGKNWSEISQFLSYYSYGYSIWLGLIIYFVGQFGIAYKVAIILNGLFHSISFILLTNIGEYFIKKKNAFVIISAFITIIYPSYLSNIHIAWDEILLTLCFLGIINCLIKLLEKRKGIILWGFGLVYIYTVHQRCLGILVTGIIITFLLLILNKINKTQMIIFVLEIFILFSIHSIIKESILEIVYEINNNSMASVNDYGSIMTHIFYWLNIEGIIKFFQSIIGKVFYLGISSIFLFAVGIYYLIGKIVNFMKLKNDRKKEKVILNDTIISMFLIASFITTLGIASIYTMNPERIDTLIYGRYTEWSIAPFLLIGLLELIYGSYKRNIFFLTKYWIIMLFGAIYLVEIYKKNSKWNLFFWVCSPVLNYFYDLSENNILTFIYIAILIVGLITGLNILIILFVKNKRVRTILILSVTTTYFILIGNYTVNRSFGSNYRNQIVLEMNNVITDFSRVYFLYDKGQSLWYVADLQVLNPNCDFVNINYDEVSGNGSPFFLIMSTKDVEKVISNDDEILVQDGIITLLYIN